MASEVDRLHAMIEEIRRMRESCEPKNADNPRYHGYSMAISGLNKAIGDISKTEAAARPPIWGSGGGAHTEADGHHRHHSDTKSGSDRLAELARRFEQWVLDGIPSLKPRYDPTKFLKMVKVRGAVGTARLLLASTNHTSYGFQRLYEIDRLDASVEFGALLPWFEELFSETQGSSLS